MTDRKLKITRKLDDDYNTFSIRIKKEIVKKLDDMSNQTNRSRNELINICLQYALEHIELEE